MKERETVVSMQSLKVMAKLENYEFMANLGQRSEKLKQYSANYAAVDDY